MNILKELEGIGIIPVVKINDESKAEKLAEALILGELNAAEITFRTSAAVGAIKRISASYPNMLVGAGTVLTVGQAEEAVAAGAKFIVSPGLNPKVVSWCTERSIPVLPGCTTPTEIEQAIELGLDTVKFFPAEQSGGIAKIKALAAPYTSMHFMPTGGISLANMHDYLSFKPVIACGGSFMVKNEYIENDDWNAVTASAKKTVSALLDFKIAHIGINSSSCNETAKRLGAIFGSELTENENGTFVGTDFEVMKSHSGGIHGHIAVSTPNVERAVYYLKKRNVKFDEGSSLFGPDGELGLIRIDEDFDGFEIHLTKRT